MLQIPTLPENPGPSTENRSIDEGANGPVSDGLKEEQSGAAEDGDRNSSANRWPREEAMALLKIRAEMDVAFRDVSPKAPLWEQVSR